MVVVHIKATYGPWNCRRQQPQHRNQRPQHKLQQPQRKYRQQQRKPLQRQLLPIVLSARSTNRRIVSHGQTAPLVNESFETALIPLTASARNALVEPFLPRTIHSSAQRQVAILVGRIGFVPTTGGCLSLLSFYWLFSCSFL